jgi:hypothetical protein
MDDDYTEMVLEIGCELMLPGGGKYGIRTDLQQESRFPCGTGDGHVFLWQ